MTLTADQKKKAAVALLIPAAAYMVYSNILSTGGPTPPPVTPVVRTPEKLKTIDLAQDAAKAVAGGGPRGAPPQIARNGGNSATRRNSSQEWTPKVGGRRPEDRADPMKTDPALRLELLARLQGVPVAAAGRSLFDFATAPPPPLPKDIKIDPKKNGKGGPLVGGIPPPIAPPSGPTGPPPEAPPPPIPLKFYGFVQGQGGKRAFFRLGEDDIFVASEGQTVQGRYKIVRIGLSAAVVEDTQFKNNQQSLRIEEIPKEGA